MARRDGSYSIPLCVKCRREMRCLKNEVFVAEADADETGGFWGRSGDLFGCPECHMEVIVGMSVLHHRDPEAMKASGQQVVSRVV